MFRWFFRGGENIATTRLMPLHIGKGRTIAEALKDSTDYIEDPTKTQKGELVTGYECDPMTVDMEFLISKRQYFMTTGRSQGDRDVIAYHTRQSFLPDEVTAEQANEIGRQLADRFTKGHHAYIVATHIDRAHIHNHIIFNSTRLDCKKKFRNFIGSAFAVRRISDRICLEHGLSIVENPKPSRGSYADWLGDDKPLTYQEQLRRAIDEVLEKKPADFDGFLSAMAVVGYSVKRRKPLSFRLQGQKGSTRCREETLGADYTETAIRDRISGKRGNPVRRGGSGFTPGATEQVNKLTLLIDVQAKLRAGKGPGYERWAKLFNIRQAAATLAYLQEHGMGSYDELAAKTDAVTERFNTISDSMKVLDKSLTDNAELQRHIVTYSKTRNTYIAYRKAGYSKKFKAENEADILLHQTAKKYFDTLGLAKLPTIKSLRDEYAVALAEKKTAYRDYRQARDDMRELLLVKANIDSLLDISEPKKERIHDAPTL